jgi:hypothetical protein
MNLQRPNEIPFKQWRAEQAAREHVHENSIWYRLKAGKYPQLKLRKVNKRVVFVEV